MNARTGVQMLNKMVVMLAIASDVLLVEVNAVITLMPPRLLSG
jgi:hypothetical protein